MPFEMRGEEKTTDIGDTTYHLIRASKDGNCLFHAAGHALVVAGKVGVELANHTTFRAHVVAYVETHAKDLDALGFKLRDGMGINGNQQDAVSVAQGQAIDRRIQYLRGARNWGDEACITAIEQLYDTEVLVFDDQGVADFGGAPFYVSSHDDDQGTQIRLCIRFRGHIPVHYDAYLADHDALRDGDAVVVDVVEKGGEVSQSAKEPWAYHMDPKGLKLFCPAIGPRQFTYSRTVFDSLSSKSKLKKPVVVALGNQLNVVEKPAPVVAVHLRNHKDKAALLSESFSALTDVDTLGAPVQERLILPLVRVDKVCINLIDLTSTDLLIDVERGKAEPPATIFLRVYRRAFGLVGAGAPNGGLLEEVELDLGKLKAKSEDLDEPARTRFTIEGAAVPEAVVKLMEWTSSPFQIVASSDRAFGQEDSAWTHAHVPSEMDILHAEHLALVPVTMLGDSPTSLADLGVKATVADLANPTIDAKPKAREDFALPALKETALGQLLQNVGIGSIDANAHNYLVEVAEGEWYAATSWASMASLQLDKETGYYSLLALYWSSGRSAFVASAADLANPAQRAQGGAVALAGRVLQRVTAVRSAISSATNVKLGNESSRMFPLLWPKKHYDDMFRWNDKERAEATLLGTFRDRYIVVRQRIDELQQNAESTTLLGQLGQNYQALVLQAFRDTVPPLNQMLEVEECQVLTELLYRAVTTYRAGLLQKGIPLDSEDVEGIKDFDTGGGKHLKGGADWKRHVFDPPLPLTFAVTAGISSCAGGITVSNEKVPEHVFMWHLDANLSIPLMVEMERLWPKGKGAPAFRTLALVTPSLWELNKYRPDNLYLPSVAADSQTVFLGRGSHWYGQQPVVAGCDLFGLDCRTEGQVDLVFTYDIDKRTEPLGKWRTVNAESEDAPSVLVHFRQALFGTYRYGKGDPKTVPEMATYIGLVTNEDQEHQAAMKLHKRETNNKSCRIPQMSAATIEAVLKQATPLLETPRFLAAEKGDQELALDALAGIFKERWTPGSSV